MTGDLPIEAVISAAREVGDNALSHWRDLRSGGAIDQWKKPDQSLVSVVDLETDRRLKAILQAIDPEAGWLSEESVDNPARLDTRRIWCVDPIDGTRDFLSGRDGWAVSIALVEDGLPHLGILYAPARDQVWVAARGHGASVNGRAIHCGHRTMLAGARVPATSLPRVDADLTMVERPNSIALRMAMVADDCADLVATLIWGFEWDIAAASLIVAEAGGRVSDAFGAPLRFNKQRADAFGLIACVPQIHDAVVTRLADRAAALSPRAD